MQAKSLNSHLKDKSGLSSKTKQCPMDSPSTLTPVACSGPVWARLESQTAPYTLRIWMARISQRSLQLVLDSSNKLIYFGDREGVAVFRCQFDGSKLQKLVDNGQAGPESDALGWCVGISISQSLGKLFWTQKGPSKGGKGRLFSADLPAPENTVSALTNVQCLLKDLPEPIDLEFDEDSRTLYWTDRGELPQGNSLNRMQLQAEGSASAFRKEILAKHFHEAIGLKLDSARKQIYVTDLGGSVYSYQIDGKITETLFADEKRAFTGVACL
jgi:hypothetical protein